MRQPRARLQRTGLWNGYLGAREGGSRQPGRWERTPATAHGGMSMKAREHVLLTVLLPWPTCASHITLQTRLQIMLATAATYSNSGSRLARGCIQMHHTASTHASANKDTHHRHHCVGHSCGRAHLQGRCSLVEHAPRCNRWRLARPLCAGRRQTKKPCNAHTQVHAPTHPKHTPGQNRLPFAPKPCHSIPHSLHTMRLHRPQEPTRTRSTHQPNQSR